MRKTPYYFALVFCSITTQNFASSAYSPKQYQQFQQSVQELQQMNQSLLQINQLFQSCKMQMKCITIGLQAMAENQDTVAQSMLDDLQAKKQFDVKQLKQCYEKEKTQVIQTLKPCKHTIAFENTQPVVLDECVEQELTQVALKGNRYAQMLLFQAYAAKQDMVKSKALDARLEKDGKVSDCF